MYRNCPLPLLRSSSLSIVSHLSLPISSSHTLPPHIHFLLCHIIEWVLSLYTFPPFPFLSCRAIMTRLVIHRCFSPRMSSSRFVPPIGSAYICSQQAHTYSSYPSHISIASHICCRMYSFGCNLPPLARLKIIVPAL
ncbi:hypothetical protein BV20DRAFT_783717 [Pilatotrama ljubarskyi]|nr:hypothetical protein BV20DRAFT_783717 [Pilatotrama ljubarskyi]